MTQPIPIAYDSTQDSIPHVLSGNMCSFQMTHLILSFGSAHIQYQSVLSPNWFTSIVKKSEQVFPIAQSLYFASAYLVSKSLKLKLVVFTPVDILIVDISTNQPYTCLFKQLLWDWY